jgi:hypothetical protein
MWESRRDFQRVWEGWEAGFLAFHAFHTLSFPWPAFRPGDAGFTATSTSAMGRTRKEMFVVIVVDECFGDYALTEIRRFRLRKETTRWLGLRAIGHLGSPRQCLRVDVLLDFYQLAVSNFDVEDPLVLERLIRGFDFSRSDANDQNPVSL